MKILGLAAKNEELVRPKWPRLVSGFVAVLLALMLVGGMPTFGDDHRELKSDLEPLLKSSGLWQGSWELFAPVPGKVNSMIVAKVEYADGPSVYWRAPDWQSMSAGEKFRHFRLMEFLERARLDAHAEVWPALAEYAARQVEISRCRGQDRREGDRVVSVSLSRHWTVVEGPEENPTRRKRLETEASIGRASVREADYDGHFEFFVWTPES